MSGVTAIIPNWNRGDLLKALLGRLARQSRPPEEVLVVDNGSEDDSVAAARGLGARVLEMGSNQGFAPAVNQGIRESRTPWIAIVNNDVEPAPDWLERLLEAGQRSEAWFYAGKLLDAAARDNIDGTYDVVCRGGCAWRAGHGRPDGPDWTTGRTIQLAPFTAALFRAELFAKAGLLDERFESYLEDVDFGLRCARLGVGGLYVPEAKAWHAGSATLGAWHPETVRRTARNQLLLVAKHYDRADLIRNAWAILVAQLLWGAVALKHGRGLAFLNGKWQGLRMFGALRGEAAAGLAAVLEEGEREIYRLQRRTGFDPYWRLYFALAGRP